MITVLHCIVGIPFLYHAILPTIPAPRANRRNVLSRYQQEDFASSFRNHVSPFHTCAILQAGLLQAILNKCVHYVLLSLNHHHLLRQQIWVFLQREQFNQ